MATTLTRDGGRAGSPASPGRLFEPGGARTLDDVIGRASRSLAGRGNARCPVCGATLVRAGEAEQAVAACGACGSTLE